MAKPYLYRWSDEVAEAVEAFRGDARLKTTKEALDAVLLRALVPSVPLKPSGRIDSVTGEVKMGRAAKVVKPADVRVSVPYAGDVPARGAVPKKR